MVLSLWVARSELWYSLACWLACAAWYTRLLGLSILVVLLQAVDRSAMMVLSCHEALSANGALSWLWITPAVWYSPRSGGRSLAVVLFREWARSRLLVLSCWLARSVPLVLTWFCGSHGPFGSLHRFGSHRSFGSLLVAGSHTTHGSLEGSGLL